MPFPLSGKGDFGKEITVRKALTLPFWLLCLVKWDLCGFCQSVFAVPLFPARLLWSSLPVLQVDMQHLSDRVLSSLFLSLCWKSSVVQSTLLSTGNWGVQQTQWQRKREKEKKGSVRYVLGKKGGIFFPSRVWQWVYLLAGGLFTAWGSVVQLHVPVLHLWGLFCLRNRSLGAKSEKETLSLWWITLPALTTAKRVTTKKPPPSATKTPPKQRNQCPAALSPQLPDKTAVRNWGDAVHMWFCYFF